VTPGKEDKKKKEKEDSRLSKSHHIILIRPTDVFSDFVEVIKGMNQ
jgi:hypothetical protein